MWSEALCRNDSDNDGRTNGEELCDPQCQWRQEQPQPICGASSVRLPSHPGKLCFHFWPVLTVCQTRAFNRVYLQNIIDLAFLKIVYMETPCPGSVETFQMFFTLQTFWCRSLKKLRNVLKKWNNNIGGRYSAFNKKINNCFGIYIFWRFREFFNTFLFLINP